MASLLKPTRFEITKTYRCGSNLAAVVEVEILTVSGWTVKKINTIIGKGEFSAGQIALIVAARLGIKKENVKAITAPRFEMEFPMGLRADSKPMAATSEIKDILTKLTLSVGQTIVRIGRGYTATQNVLPL